MNKAEETLNIKQNISEYYFTKTGEKYISDVMKQHAIEFSEWITSSGYSINKDFGIWIRDMGFMCEDVLTTEQLYNEFNEQKP